MVSRARLALTAARPVEKLVAGYCVVVIAVCLTRGGRFPGLAWIGAGHALIVVLMGLAQRTDRGRAGSFLREILPLVALFGLYPAIDLINGSGAIRTHDRTIQAWESMLFGGQPAHDWWRRWPSRSASFVLHAAYFSYYLIVPFPVAFFLGIKRNDIARQAIFSILAAFVICYLGFLVFPVAGPYYEFDRPESWFLDNGAARLVYGILATGSSFGAAFPSSHVAATWAAVLGTARAAPRLAAALALPATLLTVGVVYCQMHYATDALAGLLVAVLAAALGSHFASYRSR